VRLLRLQVLLVVVRGAARQWCGGAP